MDSIQQTGIKKESFELNYNGKIWCKHLDEMGAYADKVATKFIKDMLEEQND